MSCSKFFQRTAVAVDLCRRPCIRHVIVSVNDMTAVAGDPVVPISVRDIKATWKPIRVTPCCINITGGLIGNNAFMANSIQCQMHECTWTFIELDKNAKWFLKAVAGHDKGRLKGTLHTVGMISDICDKIDSIGFQPLTAVVEPAVAEHANNCSDDADPMNQLGDVGSLTLHQNRLAHKTLKPSRKKRTTRDRARVSHTSAASMCRARPDAHEGDKRVCETKIQPEITNLFAVRVHRLVRSPRRRRIPLPQHRPC